MNPTLQLILRITSLRLDCSDADIRLSHEEGSAEARRAFIWLACQLTGHSVATIGLFIGRPASHAEAMLVAVNQSRDSDPQLAELLDELCVECIAETQLRSRIGRMGEDHDPSSIARQIIAGRGPGAVHLQHLASAYLAAVEQLAARQAHVPAARALTPLMMRAVADDGEVAGLIAVALALDDAQFTPAEAAARRSFDQALSALVNAARAKRKTNPFPNIKRPEGSTACSLTSRPLNRKASTR